LFVLALALAVTPLLDAADIYVSANGSDANSGASTNHPLLTLQKADSLVKPGDTVWVMDGIYRNEKSDVDGGVSSLLEINQSGKPDAWITWRNFPGQHPELIAQGCWAAIDVRASYIVIDGLTLTGNNDNVRQSDAEANAEIDVAATWAMWEAEGSMIRTADYSSTPSLNAKVDESTARKPAGPRSRPLTYQLESSLYNGTGIFVNGRNGNYWRRIKSGEFSKKFVNGRNDEQYHHHIFRNLTVRKFGGTGIGLTQSDYYTIENCEVYDNCWYNTHGCSGISQNNGINLDAAPGYHNVIRNNRVWGNKSLIRCYFNDLYTDGNGIILDSLARYAGAILVANNLVYNNGGGGIHIYKSFKARIDVVNNTLWRNQQTWQLYDLGAHASTNVHFLNNLVVADKYRQVNGKTLPGITYDYNLYSGSPLVNAKGEHDLVADPLFVRPSTNRRDSDFHLRPGSPAFQSGATESFVPANDLDGQPRGDKPSRGAYQH
jgi:hypothetical protein